MATPFDVQPNALPLILTGPLVRRAQPDQVTVWVALKEPRAVTLRVYAPDDDSQALMDGVKRTLPLGTNLHVVAVTADAVEATGPLNWGSDYIYNLSFAQRPADEDTLSLAPPGSPDLRANDVLVKGAPEDHDLVDRLLYPAPAEDPADPADGNPPNGDPPEPPAAEPAETPQYTLPSFVLPPEDLGQLRIMHASCRMPHGEGPDMLAQLDELIGVVVDKPLERPQQLVLTGDQIYADDVADALLVGLQSIAQTLLGWSETLPGVANDSDQLKPGQRQDLVEDEARFTSSAARSHLLKFGEFCAMYLLAWSPVLWPQQAFAGLSFEDFFPGEVSTSLKKHFDEQKPRLDEFLATLKSVRRALANTSSYMIFDDHEVTDDWFLNLEWSKNVLGTDLGKRIINNGLMTYAIFQAWGNTPDRLANGTPGAALLATAANWSTQHGAQTEILPQLGLPPVSALESSGELWPDAAALADVLRFDYVVDGPPIVEDVAGESQQQALAYRLFVLNSRTGRQFATDDWLFDTSPARIIGQRAFESQLNVAAIPDSERCELAIVVSPAPVIGIPWIEAIQDVLAFFSFKAFADYEYWGLQKEAVQRLFSRTARLGRGTASQQNTRAIILSGDVHYGFGARISYGNAESVPAVQATIAQFTASSLKNQEKKTKAAHYLGYALTEPEKQTVATGIDDGACFLPTFVHTEPEPPGPLPGAGPDTLLGKQMAVAQNHKYYSDNWAAGREIVGYNNLGEIRIDVDGDGKPERTRQILHWYSDGAPLQTVYEASFVFADPNCD